MGSGAVRIALDLLLIEGALHAPILFRSKFGEPGARLMRLLSTSQFLKDLCQRIVGPPRLRGHLYRRRQLLSRHLPIACTLGTEAEVVVDFGGFGRAIVQ